MWAGRKTRNVQGHISGARSLVGGLASYVRRIARWAIVLTQVRGATWRDQLKLLGSAAASPVTSLRDLAIWQDPVLLFDTNVRVKEIGEFQVRSRSDDLWHLLPYREPEIHQVMTEILRPGDLFVDAGANIGVYTLLASRLVGPAGRVIAIEMMPDTAAILRRHVIENRCDNVEIVEKALSDRTGGKVSARVTAGKFGQASIAHAEASDVAAELIEVQTSTLDEICRNVGAVRLLKMDLEGAELQAIGGAQSTLERTETVIYESHTASDALAEAFHSAGFDVSRALGKDRLAQRRSRPGR